MQQNKQQSPNNWNIAHTEKLETTYKELYKDY
jgi:hypothetical protein